MLDIMERKLSGEFQLEQHSNYENIRLSALYGIAVAVN
jgi:hypothetical protein